MFYDILEQENAFLGNKNENFKKSKNWHFSKGVNPWFCSKFGHFSNFFFLENIRKENVFYDILEQKNAFLGNKNKKFKKPRNWHFSKGVNPWFCSRMFHDILERKIAFLSNKNKKLKKSKNWHFSKGVNRWFCSKIGHFSNLFFLDIIS